MISAIVLMFSVTVAILSCIYIMQRAEASQEFVQEGKANGITKGVSVTSMPEPSLSPGSSTIECQGSHHEEKEIGDRYTYYEDVCPTKEHTGPTDKNITNEAAIAATDSGLQAFFGFGISKKTNIDINFQSDLYEVKDLYYVTLNNNAMPGRQIAENEESYGFSL